MIVGIDEVGRGAWAGPLVVGAVLLGPKAVLGLTDSKKLSANTRQRLDLEIRQSAVAIGLGWVSAKQIDSLGMSQALKLAAQRALMHIKTDFNEIVIDGTISLIDDPRARTMAKADLLIPSVSAASIVAKVARDTYMAHMDTVFPGYGFRAHAGYGTVRHQSALRENGASEIHRMSFEPLSPYRSSEPKLMVVRPALRIFSTSVGNSGEDAATVYLKKSGHTILERNWKTKWCEVDIVSRCQNTIYFTEVKYRRDDSRGGGIGAVTPKKIRQMTFAARSYLHMHSLSDTDARLAAADVSGSPAVVKDFLEIR